MLVIIIFDLPVTCEKWEKTGLRMTESKRLSSRAVACQAEQEKVTKTANI